MKKIILLFAIFLGACTSSQTAPSNAYRSNSDDRPLVDDKYSLQADRKAMDEMRAQVPADRKRENDELALMLGVNETKKTPADVRNQFDTLLRKKRSLFDKDITKERETFTKDERKKREQFLKEQRDQREVYGREKHSREDRTEFFKELDEKRSEFFSTERDKRNDFESDVRERRKSFEDYVREKQNEFNQEHRAYTKRYDDMKKQEREKQKASSGTGAYSASSLGGGMTPAAAFGVNEAQELDRELEEVRGKSGTSLQSGPSSGE